MEQLPSQGLLAHLKEQLAGAIVLNHPDTDGCLELIAALRLTRDENELLDLIARLPEQLQSSEKVRAMGAKLAEQLIASRFPENSIRRILALSGAQAQTRAALLDLLSKLDEKEVHECPRAVVGACEFIIGGELSVDDEVALLRVLNRPVHARSAEIRALSFDLLALRIDHPDAVAFPRLMRLLEESKYDDFHARVFNVLSQEGFVEEAPSPHEPEDAPAQAPVQEPQLTSDLLFRYLARGEHEKLESLFAELADEQRGEFCARLKSRIEKEIAQQQKANALFIVRMISFCRTHEVEVSVTEEVLRRIIERDMRLAGKRGNRPIGACLANIAGSLYDVVGVTQNDVGALRVRWGLARGKGFSQEPAGVDEDSAKSVVTAEIEHAIDVLLIPQPITSQVPPQEWKSITAGDPCLFAAGALRLALKNPEDRSRIVRANAVARCMKADPAFNPQRAADLVRIEELFPPGQKLQWASLDRIGMAGGPLFERTLRPLAIREDRKLFDGTPGRHRLADEIEAYMGDGTLVRVRSLQNPSALEQIINLLFARSRMENVTPELSGELFAKLITAMPRARDMIEKRLGELPSGIEQSYRRHVQS